MRTPPRPTWAALWLSLFICAAAIGQEGPDGTALYVCEVREIPSANLPSASKSPEERQRQSLLAASGSGSRLVSLKVLAGASGRRSITREKNESLDAGTTTTSDRSTITGYCNYGKDGRMVQSSIFGAYGERYFLGSIPGKDPDKTDVVVLQTASEISAAPAAFPNTGRTVSVLFEFWDLPLESAAALVKPSAGAIDVRNILGELRALAQSGNATSSRLSPVSVESGKLSETAQENYKLRIEPTLSKDERGVLINYVLIDGENMLLSLGVMVKNGDSLLLGTMEPAKPGSARLVFLHTSPTP